MMEQMMKMMNQEEMMSDECMESCMKMRRDQDVGVRQQTDRAEGGGRDGVTGIQNPMTCSPGIRANSLWLPVTTPIP